MHEVGEYMPSMGALRWAWWGGTLTHHVHGTCQVHVAFESLGTWAVLPRVVTGTDMGLLGHPWITSRGTHSSSHPLGPTIRREAWDASSMMTS